MVPLPDPQIAALEAIRAAWPEVDLLMIDALVLGDHISMGHRGTDELALFAFWRGLDAA